MCAAETERGALPGYCPFITCVQVMTQLPTKPQPRGGPGFMTSHLHVFALDECGQFMTPGWVCFITLSQPIVLPQDNLKQPALFPHCRHWKLVPGAPNMSEQRMCMVCGFFPLWSYRLTHLCVVSFTVNASKRQKITGMWDTFIVRCI